MQAIFCCVERLFVWLKRNCRAILIVTCIGLMVHFTLYSNSLTNPDGLWSGMGYEQFTARSWDFKLGRWAWWFVTKLRGGVCTPGIMAPIVIFGFAVGGGIAADALRIEHEALKIACGAAVVCSPMVACVLTYYPYADIYSLAFILSAFAVACQRFDFIGVPARIALTALAVCFSVGLYQTTIGVSCGLLLMALATDVLFGGPGEERASFVRFATGALGILIGCALYVIAVKMTQAYVGVSMADYRGAGSISLGNALAKLPTSVPGAYSQFFGVLFGHDVFGNRFLAHSITAALICLGALSALIGCVHSRRPLPIVTFVVCVALLPMAALAICIIAPDSGGLMPLMVGGVVATLYFPAALVSAVVRSAGGESSADTVSVGATPRKAVALSNHDVVAGRPGLPCKVAYLLTFAAICCLAWSYMLQSNCDSMVQYKLNNQARTVATQIAGDIQSFEGYGEGTKVAVIGVPTDGSYKMPAEASLVSPYVRWSLFWRTYDGNLACWNQLLKIQCGETLNFVSGDEAKELATTSEFQSMPSYPNTGAVRMINGVLVVKVSDTSGW